MPGVEYFILHTMTPDPAQLQDWVDEIIPNVTFPATAGPVRAARSAGAAVTRRVGLIGKPLKRRHSQVMHDAAFAAAGIDARYVLLELEPDAVEDAVRRGARAGLARPRRDGAVQAARRGAVRRGRGGRRDDRRGQQRRADRRGRLVGFNTDAPGFQAGVELAMGRPLAGADVVVAGAGGAAHAVVFACLRAGAARVTVGNRTAASATALVERFADVGPGARSAVALDDPAFEAALRSADLAVNATTVGMLDPGADDPGRRSCRRRDGLRPRLRAARDAAARGGAGARPAGRERLGDAHRAGRDRVRALDRRRRHGRRHARGRRAAARRRRGAGLTDAARDDRRGRRSRVGRGRPRWTVPAGRRPATPRSTPRSASIAASGAGRPATDRKPGSTAQPDAAYRSLDDVELGPAVPDPGAIYTVGAELPGPGRARRGSPAAPARSTARRRPRSPATARRSPGTGR